MFGFFEAIDLDASKRRRDFEFCGAWVDHSKAAMPIYGRFTYKNGSILGCKRIPLLDSTCLGLDLEIMTPATLY